MGEPLPGGPQPGPPDVRFPEPAVPGAPPPLLPRPTFPWVPLPPEEATALPLEDSWSLSSPYVDPALTAGLADVAQWCSRIQVAAEPGWSAVTLLRADAPMRRVEAPSLAFIDEMSLAVTAVRASEAALPEAPAGTPLLSRLRMLHERFVPGSIRYPADAQWQELGGVPAVLDRLATGARSFPSAFSLAAEVSGGLGMVVFGYAPEDRHMTVTGVAIPLAAMAEPTETGIRWVLPRGWSGREELQLVSETVIARAHLEPLLPGWGLAEWTDAVFARAPFLRDLRQLGDRAITVPGVDVARLARFDWQPSGRGRTLTTVVTGVTGDHGFSFVIEVPLGTGTQFHTTDPDAVLATLSVAPDASPRRDMTRASLAGHDLRGADLRGVDLKEADLRGTDLRGADLHDADMSGCLLHGADLRETLVGRASLGHVGGDPELTWIYNPEIWGAHADDETRWPQEFEIFGAGIVFDGPELRLMDGELVNVPVDPDAEASAWGSVSTGHSPSTSNGQGRVRLVQGWVAYVETDAGPEIRVRGDRLLACNLRLLRGQRVFHRSGWWSIVGHDDEQGTLAMEQGDLAEVVDAGDLFKDNARRWWWHVPGSEYTARD